MNNQPERQDGLTEPCEGVSSSTAGQVPGSKANGIAGRKRILIVDDNVVFLKAMSLKLRTEGFDVVTALDGATAVSAVRQTKPDLVLLDINFPPDVAHGGGVPWNGLLILNWLRRINECKDVPVIVITGENVDQHKSKYMKAGVVGMFMKPIDHEDLLKVIRRNVGGEQLEEAPAPAGSKKILFVDDETDWRYMSTLYLTECGYEVVTAADGAEALSKAAQARPDLIILDLNLGDESGLTLMKLLSVSHPQIPIVVYTGAELDEAAVQNLLSQGAYLYLRKTTMEELLGAVGEAMNAQPEPPLVTVGRMTIPEGRAMDSVESLLIVEDDVAFGDALLLFLESHSFCVTRVTDGAEGVRQILAAEFDFVLCDMVMPNLPGDQFYLAVEAARPDLCKRFIFMTGHQADPKTDRFVRRVHGLMLWKPFPMTDLLTAIDIIRRKNPAPTPVLRLT